MVGGERWNSSGHFFAAAAEAMRRILINRARDKNRQKRGGGRKRVELERIESIGDASEDDLLAIDEALEELARHHPACAQLVNLRFFAGLTLDEATAALGLARRTADRYWAYARAWLYQSLGGDELRDSAGP
jgi:RNA polymerase sigma factor (TIGR02999 family)